MVVWSISTLVGAANNIAAPAVKDNFVLVTSAYNQQAIAKLKVTLKGIEKVWQQMDLERRIEIRDFSEQALRVGRGRGDHE